MIENFAYLILDGELTPGSDLLQVPEWIGLVVISTMAVLLIHLIILMLARAFDIQDLKVYAESEMLQALATFFMAGFILIMLASVADFAYKEFLSGGQISCGTKTIYFKSSESAMASGLDVINCKLLEKATSMNTLMNMIRQESINSGIFDQLNERTSMMGMAISQGDWDPYTYSTAESYRYANILATNLLVVLNAQAFFVVYVKKNMIHFFLPLGIILRGFHFTRSIGAFLIALAIGLYFIMPLVFLLTDPGFVRLPPTGSVLTNPSYCYKTFGGAINLVDLPKVEAIGQMQNAVNLADTAAELSSVYFGLLVHPLIVLSITLVFVRYGMTVLGGETMELTRLVSRVV